MESLSVSRMDVQRSKPTRLDPLTLAWNKGFREHELNRIEQIIHRSHDRIVSIWNREQDKR